MTGCTPNISKNVFDATDKTEDVALVAIKTAYSGGNKDGSTKELMQYLSANPSSVKAAKLLGEIYLKEGNFRGATFVYEQLSRREQNDAEILNNLALSLLGQNKPKKAQKYAKRAAALDKTFESTFTAVQEALKENE